MAKIFNVTLTGIRHLLMHADNLDWAEQLKAYRQSAEGKKNGVPGDDRSPAWSWIGSLYHDGSHVAMPAENVMRALMEAGAQVGTGKGQKTFKAQTQTGLIPNDAFFQFTSQGVMVRIGDVLRLRDESSFEEHGKVVQSLGFSLHVKRAKIGTSKHVRVRPMFAPGWQVKMSLTVIDEAITKDVLASIFDVAGHSKGLCDWRPGSKTPGPYGMFDAKVE